MDSRLVFLRPLGLRLKSAIEDGKETIVEKKSILASAIEAGREAMNKEKERVSKA